ncbi:MAG: geranyl transferase [Hydrocarboniphaga sp.]|uniref:polyprenyl synthetase family protein n=1 Tax=Hydrocarboniphaga sp. TaxID=2033016 RepID=UPI00262EFBE6|nr:farnesyl diphosphate synthase [Hydrocarboniphaga sp.]MDB5967651.1 geranyl transferase [Hydrocarboniphaga sp.]
MKAEAFIEPAVTTDFSHRLAFYRERLQNTLDRCLPAADIYPARLHEAMRYSTDGGKRLRALLVYAAGEVLNVHVDQLDAPACAIELIHAYSLVHDDLPAMDDDELRRGRPTCHRQFDEATAILVGDGLQALAFGVLARAELLPAQARIRMVGLLADAAGSRGMVGGQAVDLASENQALSLLELETLHIHKTGALIRACLTLACETQPDLMATHRYALDRYGKLLGLAYQIQDDVLDIEGAAHDLGKTVGKDVAAHKSTYPSVMGLSAAKQRAEELFDEARSVLSILGAEAMPLVWLADHIQGRRH